MIEKKVVVVMFLAFALLMNTVVMAQAEIRKDGLTASEMLLQGKENLGETFKTTMELNSQKKFTGYTKQLIADSKNKGKFIEVEQKIDDVAIDRSIIIGVVQKHEKLEKEYYRSVSLMDPMLTSEQFQDGNVFYGRMGNDKWMKVVTNPTVMKVLEEADKELINSYATYADDQKINGKMYHVIKLNPDSEGIKKITLKVMDKVINESISKSKGAINRKELETLILKELSRKEKESSSTYYINAGTRVLELLDTTELSTLTMDKLNIEVMNVNHSKFYDFNQPVAFPQIVPKDIQ